MLGLRRYFVEQELGSIMKTPKTEAVVRMAVGQMREYAIIEHAQNLERENARLRGSLHRLTHAVSMRFLNDDPTPQDRMELSLSWKEAVGILNKQDQ
jgi:hypothetical protein